MTSLQNIERLLAELEEELAFTEEQPGSERWTRRSKLPLLRQAAEQSAGNTRASSSRPDGASAVRGRPLSRLVGAPVPASPPTIGRQESEERIAWEEVPRRRHLPTLPKLPRYNGETALDGYLVQVEMAAELGGWSPEETALQVALSLEGGALQVLSDLRPEERRSWPLIQEALRRRFGRRIYAEHAREQLINRRRLDSESLGSYAADILQQTRQGYPDLEKAIQEKLALQAFIRGLRPARLREHICVHSHNSWAAVLEEAERVEPILSVKNTAPGVRLYANQACTESDEEDNLRQATAVQPRAPSGGRRRRRPECYRCGELGHLARDCPAPAPRKGDLQPPLN